jgi:hypothetical protein
MAFFCQSIAAGFSPQRTALIRQTLKRPAMGDDGIFLSVSNCGLQLAAEPPTKNVKRTCFDAIDLPLPPYCKLKQIGIYLYTMFTQRQQEERWQP